MMKKALIFGSLLVINHNLIASAGPILLIVGTRPDIIKMAPVYHAFKKTDSNVMVCSTDQHKDLSRDLFDLFEFHPDIHLSIMKPNQDLFHITVSALTQLKELYTDINPSLVIVQGDTTSAMAAAMAAFYLQIPIAHVEAGLRTTSVHAPFPEEFNRRTISLIASYHFAPTQHAADNLIHEGIDPMCVHVTGNTVVDALQWILDKIDTGSVAPSTAIRSVVQEAHKKNQKIVLLTAHRREAFAHGLLSIFTAIKEFLANHPEVLVMYPVHPNPHVHAILEQSELKTAQNMVLYPPLPYTDLIYILNQVDCVVTDSGGLQEEAASLGKYTIVVREETERIEGVEAGLAFLAGYNKNYIKDMLHKALTTPRIPSRNAHSLYGDGTAGESIANITMMNTSIIGKSIPL